MTDEYNLTNAGFFNELDLLEFRDSELAKGHTVSKVYVTLKQANYLQDSISGNLRPKTTGKKLVDYWNAPSNPLDLLKIHGIDILIEDGHEY